jgi:serine/threonine protein kinase
MTDLRAQLQEGLATAYTLEHELGRGGMATVFLARDLNHDRPVAFKVLHPELASSLGPERFLREVKLAARLQPAPGSRRRTRSWNGSSSSSRTISTASFTESEPDSGVAT